MAELKVIFFDIDDTLYSTTAFTEKARYSAIDEMIRVGLREDREVCYQILLDIVGEFSSNDPKQFNKLLARLPDSAKEGNNELLIISAGVTGYHNTKLADLKPFEDVKEFIPRIAQLPLRMGIISSGVGIKQAEKLIRLKLEQYFDPCLIFITDTIGIGKSNTELFRFACGKGNITPGEAMNVGDNPSTDIQTAHEAGLITVLREGAGKHAQDPSNTDPDYRIRHFSELYDILRKDFGLKPI